MGRDLQVRVVGDIVWPGYACHSGKKRACFSASSMCRDAYIMIEPRAVSPASAHSTRAGARENIDEARRVNELSDSAKEHFYFLLEHIYY